MNPFSNRTKKLCLILVGSFLLMSFFPTAFLTERLMGDDGSQTMGEQSEEETMTENSDGPEEKPEISYLFLGNSKTYYNNLPEMYANLVEAGTKEKISCTTLAYSSRTETEHGRAVKAVIRTQGDPTKLTDSEKIYFTLRGVKPASAFSRSLYEMYADALLDEEGVSKHYDYIVIQLSASTLLTIEERKEGIFGILNALSDQNTKVILSFPTSKIRSGSTPFTVDNVQDGFDAITEYLRRVVSEAKVCKSAVIAYTGRAYANYFLYEGLNYAKDVTSADYQIYLREKGKAAGNDLMIGDNNHPTQLGTYLLACAIYSAVYGKNAAETVSNYRAKTDSDVINLCYLRYADESNFANRNGGIRSTTVLRRTADLAYRTQRKQLTLPLSKPEIKSVKIKPNGVRIAWGKAAGAGSYAIYRKTGDSDWKKIGTTGKRSFTDTRAKTGTRYSYAVSSIAAGGRATASNYRKNYRKIRFLKVPDLKSATPVKRGIKVEWKNTGASAYIIYRRTDSGSWNKIGYSGTTHFVDRSAKKRELYSYSVRSYDSSSVKSIYDPNGIQVLNLKAPHITSVTPLTRSFLVTWKQPIEKVTGYELEYSRSKKFPSGSKIVRVKGWYNLEKKIKRLSSHKKYYVRVRAYRKVKRVIYRTGWSVAKKVRVK